MGCTYVNGDIYIGEWKNNKREGVGKFIWANNQFFDEYCSKNKRSRNYEHD